MKKGIENVAIERIASNSKVFLAGSYNSGVFLSSDSGTSWNAINNGITGLFISSLAMNDTVFFAGCHGVCRSTNNGTSWTSVNNGITNANSDLITGLVISEGKVFVQHWNPYDINAGLFQSTNNGLNWNLTSLQHRIENLYSKNITFLLIPLLLLMMCIIRLIMEQVGIYLIHLVFI